MNNPSNYTAPYWWQTVTPAAGNGGLLAKVTQPKEGSSGILGQFGESSETSDRGPPSWFHSAMPFGVTDGGLGLAAQPVGQPWLPAPPHNAFPAWNAAATAGIDWLALAGKAIEA
jgi:hypothetical protein